MLQWLSLDSRIGPPSLTVGCVNFFGDALLFAEKCSLQ